MTSLAGRRKSYAMDRKRRSMSLHEDDEALVRSCLAANQDPEVVAIEQEWDEIGNVIDEPWSNLPDG